MNGERERRPRIPENYLTAEGEELAAAHIEQVIAARERGESSLAFPEAQLVAHADNTWGDTGKAIVNNWLGLVYQLTNLDRKQQFMPGVDPNDPLLLNTAT